jgi:type VI secretion system protein ImpL
MSTSFTGALTAAVGALQRAHPAHDDAAYAAPWYLVVGEPGSGRSTAIRGMQLAWPEGGDGRVPLAGADELLSAWLAREALFLEPGPLVVGARRNPGLLKELCAELAEKRSREPLDGLVLVMSAAEIADLDERGVERYAAALRGYLVEIARELRADVPVYVVVTRYDTLWGFAEVFPWTPERRSEEPWGFTLPPDTPAQEAQGVMKRELDGLLARLEATCFARLGSDDPAETRTRAFQHLAETRAFMDRLRAVLAALAMANAYERTPWIRALILGSAVPGTGDRPRAGVGRFVQMGLLQPGEVPPRAPRPGGLPIFAFMKAVVLPERDLVPTRRRWRDDAVVRWAGIAAATLLVAAVAVAIAAAVLG